MKVNKKKYLQPNTTVLSVENVSMICSSVQPKPSNPIQTDNSYNNGGEHNGGSEEWQAIFDKRNYKEGGALDFYTCQCSTFFIILLPKNFLNHLLEDNIYLRTYPLLIFNKTPLSFLFRCFRHALIGHYKRTHTPFVEILQTPRRKITNTL